MTIFQSFLRAGRPLVLVALCAGVFAATGCKKGPEKRPLLPDPAYSINVMSVPDFWPREEMDWPADEAAARAQQDALARFGRPDFFRFVRTRDRRILIPGEVAVGHRTAGNTLHADIEWLYLQEPGKVIRFKGSEVIEEPLTDQLRAICEYGDPNDITSPTELGSGRLSYTFYDHGKKLTFENGKLVQTLEFTPMPGFEMRP